MESANRTAARVATVLRTGLLLLALTPAAPPGVAPPPLIAQGAQQGGGRITGVVTSDAGEPLAGTQLVIVGTRQGAAAGADGRYTITGVEPGSYTVQARRIGFAPATQQVAVSAGQAGTANFKLAPQAVVLEQVVSVGYGTQTRRDVTGSVTSVSGEDVTVHAAPTPAISNALQGKAAGVQVVTNSGVPGAGASVRIRGSNSITANSEPLYVIDGIPAAQGTRETDPTVNPLNSISPNDIESIEILKDASATAIYGARGANGVVLVTTRRGSRRGSQVTLESSYGTQQISRTLTPLSGPQYRQLVNDAYVNSGRLPPYTAEQIAAAPSYNYVDLMTGDAPQQSHSASFSGGDDRTRVLVSGNYVDQEGVVINSRFRRVGGLVNADRTIGSRFLVSSSLNLTRTVQGLNRTENGGIGADANGLLGAIGYDPTVPPKDTAGNWIKQAQLGEQIQNPYANASEIENPRRVSRALANITGDYDILPSLRLRSTFGGNFSFERTPFFAPSTIQPGNPAGSANVYSRDVRELTNENTLTFTRTELGPGDFDVVGGFSIQTSRFEDQFSGANAFPSDAFSYNNLGVGGSQVQVNSNRIDWTLLSLLGRAQYNLRGRYLFTVSGRRDGSSRFGENNKWAFFPSAAFAWRMSDEGFMKGQTAVSDLKLRLSYGATGNQAVDEYQSLSRLDPVYVGIGVNQEAVALAPSGAAANPDLKWETRKQFNVGVDAGFLDNRVSVTLDAYQSNTDDLLLEVQLPRISGYSSQLRNIGSVRNRGFEVALSTVNLARANFTWRSRINLAANRNRVLDLGGVEFINPGNARYGWFIGNQSSHIVKVGEPLGTFFGYKVNGLFQQGDACYLTDAALCAPGEYRVQDTDGDGQITSDDRVILGSSQPNFYGGFTNNVTVGPFSLDAFFNFSQGNKIANVGGAFSRLATGFLNEQNAVLNRWTPEHTDATIPRANNNRQRLLYSTLVEDGSFLRLQSLTLGYQLPARLIPRAQSARVFVTGQNLFVIDDYSGFDPEVNSIGGDVRFGGVDVGAYPRARIYNVGVNVSF